MSTDVTFLLVHGSWHDGSCWSAVAEQLNSAGFPSLAPTQPLPTARLLRRVRPA